VERRRPLILADDMLLMRRRVMLAQAFHLADGLRWLIVAQIPGHQGVCAAISTFWLRLTLLLSFRFDQRFQPRRLREQAM
jgi:hypothetical protein